MIGQQALHVRAFVAVVSVAAGVCDSACTSHRTTPNQAYLDPRISVETWNQLFEAEGRELSERRDLVMTLAAVKPGMNVADVGAGTGLFSMMLSDAVGPRGRVYAEEVVGEFSRYLAERAAREGRDNVVSVVGTERSVGLPPGSIDLAFLCNVYHHFEYPARCSLRFGMRCATPLSNEDGLRDSYAWRLRRVGAVNPWEAGIRRPLLQIPDHEPHRNRARITQGATDHA